MGEILTSSWFGLLPVQSLCYIIVSVECKVREGALRTPYLHGLRVFKEY
jgi:hypothetical protein